MNRRIKEKITEKTKSLKMPEWQHEISKIVSQYGEEALPYIKAYGLARIDCDVAINVDSLEKNIIKVRHLVWDENFRDHYVNIEEIKLDI